MEFNLVLCRCNWKERDGLLRSGEGEHGYLSVLFGGISRGEGMKFVLGVAGFGIVDELKKKQYLLH